VKGARLTTGMQMLGILALLVSIIILFAAVGKLGHNRKQIALVSEVSQVLTELKQLSSARPATGFSDEVARLIGYGDVQTKEILSESGNGFFSSEGPELKFAKTSLVQNWKSAKKEFAATGSVLDPAQHNSQAAGTATSGELWQEQHEQYTQLRESFDRVFAAISKDTLSADLLAANSQMLATLKNIDFVLGNRDNLNPDAYNRLLQSSVSALQAEVAQLISLTKSDGGGVLIGYESRQLLGDFALRAKQFAPVPVDSSTSPLPGFRQEQQRNLKTAIDSAESYRRLLDFASHQNRRAILFGIAVLCLALICLLLALWWNWRNQSSGNSSNSQDLELLRTELTDIANGNLSVRASQQAGATLNAIAQASNHTVEMLTGLVRVFRRAGNHLNELAGSQQYLAKRWIKSEIKRHEQMELLSRSLELQSQAIDQLQEIESTVASEDDIATNEANNQLTVNNQLVLQELALKVSACRDAVGANSYDDDYSVVKNSNLTGEGLLRMRQRMHELTGSISAVRLAAEQARLQVLNTSLQMTAYAGTAEIDDQSRLVEDMQNISNQLASSAAGAERMSSALADDLQQYAEAFASDKLELADHFEQLQQAVNECLDQSTDSESAAVSEPSMSQLVKSDQKVQAAAALDNVQQQQLVLHQIVTALNSEAEIVSDGDAIELLEQIAELQKISASLAKSAEVYGSDTID